MRPMLSVLLGLFRPAKAIDAAGQAVRWLWIPLAVVLLVSVAVKVSIGTPLQMQAVQAEADAQFQKEMESWPEDQRKQYEKDMAAAEQSGDFVDAQDMEAGIGIASTAAMVFGILGAAVAIGYIATFFFVSAKTWASPVKYTTMLTVASLSLVPHAIRNVVQSVYMASSGAWLQHAGLGALVAPEAGARGANAAYAVLSQIDIFVLWGLALLLGGLLSKSVGVERKRVVSAVVVFIIVTGVLQAVPILITSMFSGGGGYI